MCFHVHVRIQWLMYWQGGFLSFSVSHVQGNLGLYVMRWHNDPLLTVPWDTYKPKNVCPPLKYIPRPRMPQCTPSCQQVMHPLCHWKRDDLKTYEYSKREMGANKNDGHVKADKSPVKEANVLRKEEKLPCWSAGILSSAEVSAVVIWSEK